MIKEIYNTIAGEHCVLVSISRNQNTMLQIYLLDRIGLDRIGKDRIGLDRLFMLDAGCWMLDVGCWM